MYLDASLSAGILLLVHQAVETTVFFSRISPWYFI